MEAGSTAGYLGPLKQLIDARLDPKSDVKILFLGDNGLQALKKGEVDAWAGSNNRYEREIRAHGLESAFPVIATGPLLPNDVFVVSSNLSPAFIEQMRSLMVKNQEKLIQALAVAPANKKYEKSKLVPANDADYNTIRDVYKRIGQGDFLL